MLILAVAFIKKNVLLATFLQPYKTTKIALNTYYYIFTILNIIEIVIICFNIPHFQL
jgi:hypothetical protein